MELRGLAPGPEVGRLLKLLREQVLDGDVAPEREALLDALRSL
jgi:hypothetical protein